MAEKWRGLNPALYCNRLKRMQRKAIIAGFGHPGLCETGTIANFAEAADLNIAHGEESQQPPDCPSCEGDMWRESRN